jgi:nitroreductase
LSTAARGQTFLALASATNIACKTEPGYVMTCGQHCYPIGAPTSMDHMSLAAMAEGLGFCWIGAFYEDMAKQILGIPDKVRVVAMLSGLGSGRVSGCQSTKEARGDSGLVKSGKGKG